MQSRNPSRKPPVVSLVGHIDHPDFRDAVGLLKASAQLVVEGQSPELVVIAQSRPGAISERDVVGLRRNAPLAGIIGILGSWCEGETRTGTPWPGVPRVYWYDFPAWWRRQLALRTAGRCPDWARPDSSGVPISPIQHPTSSIEHPAWRGTIVICTQYRDTAFTLGDVFQQAGYATVWQRGGSVNCVVRGATAGIWDGGQLDECEANDLADFCRALASDAVPVIAMLDFPRRQSVDRALQIGATSVLGKPWQNEGLIATIQTISDKDQRSHAA